MIDKPQVSYINRPFFFVLQPYLPHFLSLTLQILRQTPPKGPTACHKHCHSPKLSVNYKPSLRFQRHYSQTSLNMVIPSTCCGRDGQACVCASKATCVCLPLSNLYPLIQQMGARTPSLTLLNCSHAVLLKSKKHTIATLTKSIFSNRQTASVELQLRESRYREQGRWATMFLPSSPCGRFF